VREMIRRENAGETMVWIDESGFNLHIRRRFGRNVIGERATVEVPNSRGGNLTLILAIGLEGVLHYHLIWGSCNTEVFINFLDHLTNVLEGPSVLVMDNVAFHRKEEVKQLIGCKGHNMFLLPAYSPFLNPIEEVFSLIKVHVGSGTPNNKASLLDITEKSIPQVTALKCQGYVRHSREFYDACLDHRPIYNAPNDNDRSSDSQTSED
jgi:transposase